MGSVKIVGRNDGWLQKPTTFLIQVTGHGTPFAVKRRYKEFLELEATLRPQFPGLPSMPPKGFAVRRLSPGFLDSRQRRLDDLLDAALAMDPVVSNPAFRVFLGLAKNTPQASPVTASSSPISGEGGESSDRSGTELDMSGATYCSDCSADMEASTDCSHSVSVDLEHMAESWTDCSADMERLAESSSADMEEWAASAASIPIECALCNYTCNSQREICSHMQFIHYWLVTEKPVAARGVLHDPRQTLDQRNRENLVTVA